MARLKQDDIDPTEVHAGEPDAITLPEASGPITWELDHHLAACSDNAAKLHILEAILAGGAFSIPETEGPPRTAERLWAIVDEVFAYGKARGRFDRHPLTFAPK